MRKANLNDIISGQPPEDESPDSRETVNTPESRSEIYRNPQFVADNSEPVKPTLASVTQAAEPEIETLGGFPAIQGVSPNVLSQERPRVVQQKADLSTVMNAAAETTPVPQTRERIVPDKPVTADVKPYNQGNIEAAEAERRALDEKPVNKDKGVRGFLKELFENVLWGISQTYQANPHTPWQALLISGGAAGAVGAFDRTLNERIRRPDEIARADEKLGREIGIGDKMLERDKRVSDMENTRRDNDRMEQAEKWRTEYQKRMLENAKAKMEQGEVKMWLDYIRDKGYNPEKDKFIASFLQSKNIELEPVAGKAQPRVWVDGALMERDPKTGDWTFAVDGEGNPVFSQGKQLVPVQTSAGTFLMPQQSAGYGAIQQEGRLAAIANQQSQAEAQAEYDYQNETRKFNAEQSKLVAAQTKALTEKAGYEKQLADKDKQIAEIDPKKDYDGSERRKLQAEREKIVEKINNAQAEADAASRQFELNLQNPPVKRRVPQYQTPNVSYDAQKPTFTKKQIEDEVKSAYPNLKGKELEEAIQKALKSPLYNVVN